MASLSDSLVQQLLNGRYIASLATQKADGCIHMVAVWFLFDGRHVYIATANRSRKAQNLQANPNVTLMIDSRDPLASFGTTLLGTAQILAGDSSRNANVKIHEKYLSGAALADPKVGPVFAAWDDVTIQITPKTVISWDMRQADQQAFGGAFKANPTYLLPTER